MNQMVDKYDERGEGVEMARDNAFVVLHKD